MYILLVLLGLALIISGFLGYSASQDLQVMNDRLKKYKVYRAETQKGSKDKV